MAWPFRAIDNTVWEGVSFFFFELMVIFLLYLQLIYMGFKAHLFNEMSYIYIINELQRMKEKIVLDFLRQNALTSSLIIKEGEIVRLKPE